MVEGILNIKRNKLWHEYKHPYQILYCLCYPDNIILFVSKMSFDPLVHHHHHHHEIDIMDDETSLKAHREVKAVKNLEKSPLENQYAWIRPNRLRGSRVQI